MGETIEQRVGELEDAVVNLTFKVRDHDFHIERLNSEVKDIKETIHRFESKFDSTKKEMLEIVKEGTSNVPKWMWGLTVSVVLAMGLTGVGWVISGIIYHH